MNGSKDTLRTIARTRSKVEAAAELIREAQELLDDTDRDDLQTLLTDDLEQLEETSRVLEHELDPDEDVIAELP